MTLDPKRKWKAIKGQGEAYLWIVANVAHQSDECLVWPFSTNGTGYGRLGYDGRGYYAHRLMCEMAHGTAPTPDLEVAHSCGNGMGGCCNPRHLEWKTRSENHLDRRRHGTHATSKYGPRGKLTSTDKMEILALKGKMPQRVIAAKYGVHFETISRIHRTDPNRQLKVHPWWPAEDQSLREAISRGESPEVIAAASGRTVGSITARMYKLKITGAHSR